MNSTNTSPPPPASGAPRVATSAPSTTTTTAATTPAPAPAPALMPMPMPMPAPNQNQNQNQNPPHHMMMGGVPVPVSVPAPKYSPIRAPGHEHIPLYPRGFIALRIVQLVLCLLVLGLTAYGCAALPTSGNIFMLVVSLFTLITSVYHLVTHYSGSLRRTGYNYWAVLALDIFLVIMWLASFALLASEASFLFSYFGGFVSYYDDYYGVSSYSSSSYALGYIGVAAACMAAAAGLGGILLYVFFPLSFSIPPFIFSLYYSPFSSLPFPLSYSYSYSPFPFPFSLLPLSFSPFPFSLFPLSQTLILILKPPVSLIPIPRLLYPLFNPTSGLSFLKRKGKKKKKKRLTKTLHKYIASSTSSP